MEADTDTNKAVFQCMASLHRHPSTVYWTSGLLIACWVICCMLGNLGNAVLWLVHPPPITVRSQPSNQCSAIVLQSGSSADVMSFLVWIYLCCEICCILGNMLCCDWSFILQSHRRYRSSHYRVPSKCQTVCHPQCHLFLDICMCDWSIRLQLASSRSGEAIQAKTLWVLAWNASPLRIT
jgi:hypothetical protein